MGRCGNFKIISKIAVLGVLFLLLLSFGWDRIELESRAFVITIGIDAGDGEYPFEVSMNISDTAAIGGGEKESYTVTRTAMGGSLADAMRQIEAKISDKIYYGHAKMVVLGESVLEDRYLLGEVIDTFVRNDEINIKTIVMATEKTAAEILSAKTGEQSFLGTDIADFYNKNDTNTASSVVKLDIEKMEANLRNDRSVIIPKIDLSDDEETEISIGGVAVVKDFSLAGYIPEESTGGFLWLKENAAGTRVAIDVEGGHITLLVSKSKPKLDFYEEGGRLYCLAKLKIEGSIEGARFVEEDLFETGKIMALQQDFAEKIHKEIEETFYVLQQDFAVDGFGLKEQLRKKKWRLYQAYGPVWESIFEDIQLDAEINLTIRNTGAIK